MRDANIPVIADGGIGTRATSPRPSRPEPVAAGLIHCWRARKRVPARQFCTRAAPSRPIAAWALWRQWHRVPVNVTSKPPTMTHLRRFFPTTAASIAWRSSCRKDRGPRALSRHRRLIVYQLVGGVKSGMGYVGCSTIAELQESSLRSNQRCRCVSHVHDVMITREAPNYRVE